MTAHIAGFVSRSGWGARLPRSVSRNVRPQRGGVAVHYGGSGGPPGTHLGCVSRWRGWQAFHMDTQRWSDIAYSFGFCDHGYVLAGRGFGVRTAANGTNDGNDRFLAACWIGGGATVPSRAALDALEWIVAESRRLGAGDEVRPHRSFKSTACPGVFLTTYARSLDGQSVEQPVRPKPAPDDQEETVLSKGAKGNYVALMQRCLKAFRPSLLPRYGVDGDLGDETVAALRAYQKSAGLPQTGSIDGLTAAGLRAYLKE